MLQRLTFTAHFGHRKRRVDIVKTSCLGHPRPLVESLSGVRRIIAEGGNGSHDQRVVIVFVWRLWSGTHALKISLSIGQAIRPPWTVRLTLLPMLEADLSAKILFQPTYFLP